MFQVNNLRTNVITQQPIGDQTVQTDQARLQALIHAFEQNQKPRAEALHDLAAFIKLNDQGAVTSLHMQEAVEYLADHMNDHEAVMVNSVPWGSARLASFAADNALGFLKQGRSPESKNRLLRCITRLLEKAPTDRDRFELSGHSFSRAQLGQFAQRLNSPDQAHYENSLAAAEYDRVMGTASGWDATQNVHVGVVEGMAVQVFNHMITKSQSGLPLNDAKSIVDNWLEDSDLNDQKKVNARSILRPFEITDKHKFLYEKLPVVVGYVSNTPELELKENLFLAMAEVLNELGAEGDYICSAGWRNRIILFPVGIDPATNQFGINEEINDRIAALAVDSNDLLDKEVDALVKTFGLNIRDISGLIDEHRQHFIRSCLCELVLIGGVPRGMVIPPIKNNIVGIDAYLEGVEPTGTPSDIDSLIRATLAELLPPLVEPVPQPPVGAPDVINVAAAVPRRVVRRAAIENAAVNTVAPNPPPDNQQALRFAIDALDVDAVRNILPHLDDLDFQVVPNKTPVQYLISEASETSKDALEILNLICSAGADVDKVYEVDYYRNIFPAIEYAIRNYKLSFVEALLSNGANPNRKICLSPIILSRRGENGAVAGEAYNRSECVNLLSFVRSDYYRIGVIRTAVNGPLGLPPVRKPTIDLYIRNPDWHYLNYRSLEKFDYSRMRLCGSVVNNTRILSEAYKNYAEKSNVTRQTQLAVDVRLNKAKNIEAVLLRAGAYESFDSWWTRIST